MSLSTFETILRVLPKDIRIDFSGYVEPFFNPVATRMVEMAVKAEREVQVYTTLMGMTDEDFIRIQNCPPNFIKIHAPDRTGLKIPARIWLKQFSRFLSCNLPFEVMAMGEFEPDVTEFFRARSIPVEFPVMISRGGNLWKPTRIEGPLVCGEDRWHQNVILPNGNVYACCMDYGLTMPLGNLLTEDYSIIEQRAEEMRQNNNPPADSICRTCEWAKPISLGG